MSERFKKIKKTRLKDIGPSAIYWLIEQVERVEELERQIEESLTEWEGIENLYLQDEKKYQRKIEKLEAQNQRYREQLGLIKKDTFCEDDEFISVRHVIRKRAEKGLDGDNS